jgi:carbohydrate-binding DOMON domain-containing protein
VQAAVIETNKAGLGFQVHPPADPSYKKQLSMEQVLVYTSGRDIQLRVRMAEVTSDWNPPQGFDHVYFNVFFDFPGHPGKRFFPKLDYSRVDFEFNTGFLLHGWGIRSFGAADTTPDTYGEPLIGEIKNSVDTKTRTIVFTFSTRFFEKLQTFSGTKIFVSTWDGYLGELRTISNRKEDWSFYVLNGSGVRIPKIYDYILLTL